MCETCRRIFIEAESKIGWITIFVKVGSYDDIGVIEHKFCSAPCAIKFLKEL